jgi:hypothetical protein
MHGMLRPHSRGGIRIPLVGRLLAAIGRGGTRPSAVRARFLSDAPGSRFRDRISGMRHAATVANGGGIRAIRATGARLAAGAARNSPPLRRGSGRHHARAGGPSGGLCGGTQSPRHSDRNGGRLIADLVLKRRPFIDPGHWDPARFASDSYPTEASVEAAMGTSFVVSSVRASLP